MHKKPWIWVLCWMLGAAHAQDAQFDVFEYRVEGNSTLSVDAIETAIYPYLGEKKTIADVEQAREALEKAYHQGGYLTVFVNIPEQKVDAGVVRLRVVQGEVERLRVTGSRYYSLGEIKARVPELAEGGVPYFPDVQKQLAGLSRAVDRKVTPVLRPGREPGKMEVELKMDDKAPLHGSVELNDRYSANTSKTRLAASVRWDNLWQKDHSLGVSLQLAPENLDDSKALSATYSAPLASGNYLALYGVRTESDVASLGTLGVIGKGTILGLRYILPLRGRPSFNHSLTLGLDYKDFSQTVALQGADSFNTPVSYLPFTLGWSGDLNDGASSTQYNIAANFHLRDVVGDQRDFANKRFKASSGYFFLRGSLNHARRWDDGMALRLNTGFQATDQALISNEQFALGGVDSVRGYLESEVLGDYGLHVGLEWQSPTLAKTAQVQDLHAVAFLDWGWTAIHDPLPKQTENYTLAGAGLGMRLMAFDGWTASLDVAWALRDGGSTQSGDARGHFKLGYTF